MPPDSPIAGELEPPLDRLARELEAAVGTVVSNQVGFYRPFPAADVAATVVGVLVVLALRTAARALEVPDDAELAALLEETGRYAIADVLARELELRRAEAPANV